MADKPRLPPLFRLVETQADADLRTAGRRLAEGGAAGSFLWSPRSDRFQAALVVEPGEPLGVAVWSVYLAMLAMGDALGSLIPAGIDVTFIWPNQINLNGARLGGVALDVPGDTPHDAVPDWLLLSFDLAVTAAGAEATADSIDVSATTLEDEGCGGISSVEMVETLARHAMTWSNRWHEDGFLRLRSAWVKRVNADSEPVSPALGGGKFIGLDEAGDLNVEREDGRVTLSLLDAIAGTAAPGEGP